MALRLTALTLVASLLLPFGTIQAAEGQGRAPGRATLALPITGTLAGGGTFTGSLSLQRFVAREGRVVAVGLISGVLDDGNGERRTGLQGPVELPVTVEQAGAAGSPAIRNQRGADRPVDRPAITYVQQQTCGILHLEIGGTTLTLLGLTVALDPVVLDVSGESGGALGNLVCQILDLLNNVVGLVGLLNQLLGLLGGLTAGLPGMAA